MSDRLFVLQVVVIHEHLWFCPFSEDVERTERDYTIDQLLFAAFDEETAYNQAVNWLARDGFSDSHHDGRGDRTNVSGAGIHQLEEIVSRGHFPREVENLYGVHLPGFDPECRDSKGMPVVRQKENLEVFRLLHLRRGT
jgi:hypothetical protein